MVALVLLVHCGLILFWLVRPEQANVVVSEMSVSIAMQPAPIARVELPKPAIARVERTPVARPTVREVADVAPQPLPTVAAPPAIVVTAPVAAAPVVDTEPDYTASYLHNPLPAYPMVARRMGWQGSVLLNVEVLAEGVCGGVNVARSSGHEVLDNAAISTVKTWRFTPAHHAGHAVTQWFRLPINFSLEDK